MRFLHPLLLLLIFASSVRADSLPVLETVGAVRALRPEESQRHYPVKLRGTITYYSAQDGHAFLQDETGGIFFRPGMPDEPGRVEFLPGERVEISGVTVQGRFSPSVAGGAGRPVSAVRLGVGELPDPLSVTFAQLQSGRFHDQYVKLRATIREADLHNYLGGQRIGLALSSAGGEGGEKIRAYLANPATAPEAWVNVPAELRGVVAGGGDEQARLRDVRLLIPSPAQVMPDFDTVHRAFAQKPRPFTDLFRYEPPAAGAEGRYVRVVGVATLAKPDLGFYVGDGQSGLWVQTPQNTRIVPGDSVDLIGMLARDQHRTFLQDAIVRVTGTSNLPPARLASVEEAASGKLTSSRITVEGELVDKLQQPGYRRLFLEAGGRTFQAQLAENPEAGADYGWKAGSTLRITGICDQPPPASPGAPSMAFALLVGTEADVTVVRTPPWLTPQRLRTLLLALGGVIALGALWVALLRRQVYRQTQVIAQQTRQHVLTEERQRIARELHDTLEQQLTGVHLHLDAVSDWVPDAPSHVQSALGAARAMLEHSRSEARQSVFELRSPALEQLGLVGAVRFSGEHLATSGQSRITVTTTGGERRLPRLVEFHLLRVAQEAMTNALKHADADEIAVTFAFGERDFRMTIRDNGRGFDSSQPPSDGNLHYGLLGMRERLAKIQARLLLQTAPGAGTSITIDLPVPTP